MFSHTGICTGEYYNRFPSCIELFCDVIIGQYELEARVE